MQSRVPIFSLFLFFVWATILVLSYLKVSSVKPVSEDAALVILIGLVGMLMGSIASYFFPIRVFVTRRRWFGEKVLYFAIFVSIILSLSPVFNVIAYINENGLENIRSIIFMLDEDGNSVVLGSARVQLLLSMFIKPFLYYIFILSLYRFFYFNEVKFLFLSLFCIFLMSIVTFGRFFLYHIAIFFIIGFLLKLRADEFVIKRSVFKLFFRLIIFLSLFFITISSFRGGDGVVDAIINYHLLGVHIFSSELATNFSQLNSNTMFSFLSFGVFERLFVIVVTKFGIELQSTVVLVSEGLNVFRDVGLNKPLYMNAFGTWFYSLYYDGGVYWVFASLFVFGCILTYFERVFLKFNDAKSFCIILSLFFIGYFSIFASVLESSYVFMFVLSVLFARRDAR
ncbi:O-antigen polymerase [Vibrio alginolyticus]|uniref:O-antigen polymerase n=1 Tax=Vibrio alginolyticus TaxID=663 RepID=UPI003D7C3AB4